jgi:beta-galactosidase
MNKHSFDCDWLFDLGEVGEPGKSYNDSAWRKLDLPHDWSIELPRNKDNPCGFAGGFVTEGVGWYRKHFYAPRTWSDQRVLVEFEGVYRDAEVWLNGRPLGVHPYGYTTFAMDLTPYLELDAENVLTVRVNNTPHGHTRWYSGSGIYRHVWLLTAPRVHVAHWGLAVTTPEVAAKAAVVEARTTVENRTDADRAVVVRWRAIGPSGKTVARGESKGKAKAGVTTEFQQRLAIRAPKLWSPDAPHLYRMETEVYDGRTRLDGEATPFGIRTIAFNAEQGFVLNGRSLKMRGGCVHHDCGPLGAVSIDRAEERKVEVLKASGFNAVRCAHNPPAPAFLDACDRLGMLVMDEAFDTWRMHKPRNFHAYQRHFDKWWRDDLDSMLLRDRNHPSIVVWSIGNELEERSLPEGADVAAMLAARVRELDPTRPVTAAICDTWGNPNWSITDPLFANLDVCGYNYLVDRYRTDHQRFPKRVILSTESYPAPQFAFDYWKAVEELPYVAGDFAWTALDYIGEAGIGHDFLEGDQVPLFASWPYTNANCGDIDICGDKRPQSYYRDVFWKRAETLYLGVRAPVPEGRKAVASMWGWVDLQASWNWPGCEGKTLAVEAYFDCDEIELFLNGRSLGTAPAGLEAKHRALFNVAFEPGELKAVAKRAGKPVAKAGLTTTGAPRAVRLTADRASIRADRNDLAYVVVELCDSAGRPVPDAADSVRFAVEGPGEIVAVANADPKTTAPYRGREHRLWRGRGLVILRPTGQTGDMVLHAIADGMKPGKVAVSTVAPQQTSPSAATRTVRRRQAQHM